MKKSLFNNFIYQFLYQFVVLIIPLALSPFLTRTLRESSLGIFTYVDSIAYYFIIIGMLGISRHGQRLISQNSDDQRLLRKSFWSLFSVHIVFCTIAVVLYFLFISIFVNENRVIYIIDGLYVASAMFDITWFFYGIENFKSVVIKNLVVRLGSCILIFLFIKSPSDLWLYTLINAGSILIGQISVLPQAVKIVPPISFNKTDVKQHIKPLFVFAISVIAAALYTVFDKTLLGIITVKENVAFYEYANKIITVPKTIIGVIGTVMFPRVCRLSKNGDIDAQKRYIGYSFFSTAFIGMGAMFGILAVGQLFINIYYGTSFAICGPIMMALSPVIYIVGTGDVIRTQIMIPNGMDKQFNICILLNAVINLILSIMLIPILGIYGAVIGTLSAELFGLIYQIYLCRDYIKFKDILQSLIPFIIIGMIMFLFVNTISKQLNSSLSDLMIEISGGIAVYFICVLIYLFLFKKDILKRFMK